MLDRTACYTRRIGNIPDLPGRAIGAAIALLQGLDLEPALFAKITRDNAARLLPAA